MGKTASMAHFCHRDFSLSLEMTHTTCVIPRSVRRGIFEIPHYVRDDTCFCPNLVTKRKSHDSEKSHVRPLGETSRLLINVGKARSDTS